MTATLQELLDNANEETRKWRKLYFDLKCDYLKLHHAGKSAKKTIEGIYSKNAFNPQGYKNSPAWQELDAVLGDGLLDPGKIQKVTLYP